MAEILAHEANQENHEKAPFFKVALLALRDRIDAPKTQFHAYFMALFSDDDYTKVLDCISKVDKSFKAPKSSVVNNSTNSTPPIPRRPPIPPATCFFCGLPGHIAARCFRRLNRNRPHPYPSPNPPRRNDSPKQ